MHIHKYAHTNIYIYLHSGLRWRSWHQSGLCADVAFIFIHMYTHTYIHMHTYLYVHIHLGIKWRKWHLYTICYDAASTFMFLCMYIHTHKYKNIHSGLKWRSWHLCGLCADAASEGIAAVPRLLGHWSHTPCNAVLLCVCVRVCVSVYYLDIGPIHLAVLCS